MDSLTAAGTEYARPGLHTFTADPDGDFVAAANVYPAPFDKPGITLESSYPFYLRSVSGGWVESDEAFILDSYNITLRNDANETRIQQYFQWTIGMDVTVKTDATKYYKPPLSYWDYGYWFEDDVIDTTALMRFALTPWTPSGSSGNWTVVGGWNGIMSVSVIGVDYGLVSDDATENYGHTIQNMHSVGAAVNMYTSDTDSSVSPVSFSDSVGLAHVPSAIDFELSARLGAGCQYQTDAVGHVYDLAVRNVFVEYRVRMDILSTLVWSLRLGHQGGMQPPDENNTSYDPQFTSWNAMFEAWRQLFYSSGFPILVIVLCVGGIVVVILLIRRRGKSSS